MLLAEHSFFLAAAGRILHAAVYLIAGGTCAWWWLRREAPVAAATTPTLELPPPVANNTFDQHKAEALLAQLHELTTDVAHGVGEHSTHVAAISRELTVMSASSDNVPAAPVVQAIASLLAANTRLEEQLAHASSKMQEQAHELEVQLADALTDPLTGIPNRRAFDREMSRRLPEFRRMGTPLSLVMIDVDFFKKFNDTHGHQAGDEVLRCVARVLKETVRDMDLPARFGGEEFAAILPTARIDVAKQVAERIRIAIENARIEFQGVELRVTASIGVAEICTADDKDSLVQRADQGLYAAKKGGRNCGYYHDERQCLPIVAGQGAIASAKPSGEAEDEAGTNEFFRELERLMKRLKSSPQPASALLIAMVGPGAGADAEWQRTAHLSTLTGIREHAAECMVATLKPFCYGVILNDKDANGAVATADSIHSQLALLGLAGPNKPLTASFGVAEHRPGDDAASLLARAEESLRSSLAAGGDQIYFHTDQTTRPMMADLQIAR